MHDPLCFEFDSKDDDCFDHSLNSPFCFCELITKVREDERARHRDRDRVHVDYCRDAACGGCYEIGYAE